MFNFSFKNETSENWYKKQINSLENERKKLLLPFEKRKEMRKTSKFSSTNDLWNDNHFNTVDNIGEICSLTKQFDKENGEHLFEDWKKYYLEHGKSLNEIYELSVNFQEKCKENNILIDESEALNYCYIRIIDESYIGYVREQNSLARLSASFGEYKFGFMSSSDDMKCGIDIAVYNSDGRIIGGFQVKSENARKRKRIRDENNVRFNRCKKAYNFKPMYLEIDEHEDLSSEMKKDVEKYIIEQENFFKQV